MLRRHRRIHIRIGWADLGLEASKERAQAAVAQFEVLGRRKLFVQVGARHRLRLSELVQLWQEQVDDGIDARDDALAQNLAQLGASGLAAQPPHLGELSHAVAQGLVPEDRTCQR